MLIVCQTHCDPYAGRRHCSKVPDSVQLSRQAAEMTYQGFSRMLWQKPLTL